MRRVIAAALTLSVLGGLFVVTPVLAGTYTTYGECTWTEKGSPFGMWMDYPEETFYSLAAAEADVQAMATDCKSRHGTLTSNLTTVVAAQWKAYGTCSWRERGGMGMWMDYPAQTYATRAGADSYVQYMAADCKSRRGKLTTSITEV